MLSVKKGQQTSFYYFQFLMDQRSQNLKNIFLEFFATQFDNVV